MKDERSYADMLFIRNQNGSHNPRESMDLNDFMIGVDVLTDAVAELAEG